jgi:ADP-ribosylglycohydrolase
MAIPADYTERVYAGVLGKIIGVYLGRPFEGWSYERIMEHLGEIWYYVHERLDVPLIVTDDDISGTFTFIRALEDDGPPPGVYSGVQLPPTPTAEQIGANWLNYLIDRRTVLWWGGLGNSTEHTAYVRLKSGIPAPRSGSIEVNGQVVAEQIGAQIFIDGWGMVAPGDPGLAADLARRAGSVSHDGVAIHGAQVVAALEAMAFVEHDLDRCLDAAVAQIPRDSLIYRMIADLRDWRAAEPDWRVTRENIARNYGYDKYYGNCHMVPNHALIIHSLLHGDDDFGKTLMIVNTCGWDTDCNSANVGCIMGIKNGLAGIEAGADYRGPVADRMYLPTADGGRAITDAVTATYRLANLGRRLAGLEPERPKNGARFHFSLPGSVQGWQAEDSTAVRGTVAVTNTDGRLALRCAGLAEGRAARVATPTFIPSVAVKDYFERRGYGLMACPTLSPGQTVRAQLAADAGNEGPLAVSLYVQVYGEKDEQTIVRGPAVTLPASASQEIAWQIGPQDGPIAQIGVEVRRADGGPNGGAIYLDRLGWDGAPDVTLTRPNYEGSMWRAAWVNAVDQYEGRWGEPFRLVQNAGTGLLMHGSEEWSDYRVQADVTPHMVSAAGLAARVRGLRRYYALMLAGVDGGQNGGTQVHLVKMRDDERILATVDFPWEFGRTYILSLALEGNRIRGYVNDALLFDVTDGDADALAGGGVALVATEGRTATQAVRVAPLD